MGRSHVRGLWVERGERCHLERKRSGSCVVERRNWGGSTVSIGFRLRISRQTYAWQEIGLGEGPKRTEECGEERDGGVANNSWALVCALCLSQPLGNEQHSHASRDFRFGVTESLTLSPIRPDIRTMGQIHHKYLSDVRVFGCSTCHTHLATLSSMLSRVRAPLPSSPTTTTIGLASWKVKLIQLISRTVCCIISSQ